MVHTLRRRKAATAFPDFWVCRSARQFLGRGAKVLLGRPRSALVLPAEGVAKHVDTDGLIAGGEPYFHHVEPAGAFRASGPGQISCAEGQQRTLFANRHRFRGRAGRRAPAGLHLDKDDVALMLADDVELAAAEAKVADQHAIAPRRQRLNRGVLAGPAPRAPHGPRSDG